MCFIEACVAAAGILFICLTGWLDPLFSPDQVSARSVLSWSCHGVASFVPERQPFLSFHSLAKLLKKVNFSTPLPLVWNECSTSILHVLFSSCKPEFSGISLCSPSSSSPSASLGHQLTHLQLSLMVSAQRYLQFRPWTIFTSLRFKTRSQSQQTRLRLSELEEGPRPLTKYGIHRINPPY